jgi:hypothetical protein
MFRMHECIEIHPTTCTCISWQKYEMCMCLFDCLPNTKKNCAVLRVFFFMNPTCFTGCDKDCFGFFYFLLVKSVVQYFAYFFFTVSTFRIFKKERMMFEKWANLHSSISLKLKNSLCGHRLGDVKVHVRFQISYCVSLPQEHTTCDPKGNLNYILIAKWIPWKGKLQTIDFNIFKLPSTSIQDEI